LLDTALDEANHGVLHLEFQAKAIPLVVNQAVALREPLVQFAQHDWHSVHFSPFRLEIASHFNRTSLTNHSLPREIHFEWDLIYSISAAPLSATAHHQPRRARPRELLDSSNSALERG
jgi:hypothetical protein